MCLYIWYMPSCFGLPWNILIKTEIFSKIFSCAFNVTTYGIVWNVFHQKTEHFPSLLPADLDFYSLKEVRSDWAEVEWCPGQNKQIKIFLQIGRLLFPASWNWYLFLKTQNYHLDTDRLTGFVCWWFTEGRATVGVVVEISSSNEKF